jgi:site-specific recombinase XerD
MRLTPAPTDNGFPQPTALAALRGWYAGLPARQAVERYLPGRRVNGLSSRAILNGIRQQLRDYAARRHRQDLVELLDHPAEQRLSRAKVVLTAIETLRHLPVPQATMHDDVSQWLPRRAAQTLKAAGLQTLGDIAPRTLRKRRWWVEIPGLGLTTARALEGVLAQMPAIMGSARELAALVAPACDIVPWERLQVPLPLDGSSGSLRAPSSGCTLAARTDRDAVQAWLMQFESATTARAYRKEAERLLLWALFERGKALSSLMQEDAVAYRSFLRAPLPRTRWVGPARPRRAADWKPFQGELSARSVAYALTVINALFRWLVEQRYLLANPFAGLKVKGSSVAGDVDAARALTQHEWRLTRIEADKLELSLGWSAAAAWRLRFILDFWLATGLRPSELVQATLGNIDRQEGGDSWLHVRGKGDKPGRVGLPSLAIAALERYLAQRRLPVSPQFWNPNTLLLPALTAAEASTGAALSTARLWALLKRFFCTAADQLANVNPALSDKLRRMTPHWLRHTHATVALAAGMDLRAVRDNLRHANISTTSAYLNPDDSVRAQQLNKVFSGL